MKLKALSTAKSVGCTSCISTKAEKRQRGAIGPEGDI